MIILQDERGKYGPPPLLLSFPSFLSFVFLAGGGGGGGVSNIFTYKVVS